MNAQTNFTRYTIGIDTGGTYTDAVIIEVNSRRIISTAKALTTKGDLAVGVIQALKAVLALAGNDFDLSSIATVCLSTTLATNALVEGHGAKVGVFLIGFDDVMAKRSGVIQNMDDVRLFRINGGHDYAGSERTQLSLEMVKTALEGEASNLEAYSVTAHYAMRNPEHELRVQALIRELTACPVTASREISNSLNDPLRALTATLNAKIIPLISGLISAVEASLSLVQYEMILIEVNDSNRK